MRSAARFSFLAILLAGFSAWSCAAEVPVIPREQIFGPVARAKARISPDGRRLAYLAPTAVGAFNIWVTDIGSHAAGQSLTRVNGKGIDGYRWAEDNTHILYWTDHEGDEVWHLYSLDIRTGRSLDLTPFPNVKIQNLLTDEHHPHEVLVGLNKRIPTAFDMYRINIEDGSMRLEATNPGDVISWTADSEFNIRAATAFVPTSGATVLRVRERQDDPWRDLLTWSFEESLFEGQINGGSIVAGYTLDGKSVYAISATGSDHSRVVKVETATGHWQTIAGADCDVASDSGYPGVSYDLRPLLLANPRTGDVDAVAFECAERTWQALNPAVAGDLTFLRSHLPGFPYITSRSRDDALWVVATWAGDRPPEYSLFDRHKKKLQPLFSERPYLSRQRLSKPQALTITARDGSKIPVYLTRPTAAASEKDARVPLVLYPHGGPWDRDHDDYNPFVQFLANRGYAVLQVQYRGSVGFGKAYLNAGNHEFGLKMRDDLIDAVEWTIQTGVADPARIAVYGESGGGYLALRVTEARPDLFRATVDVVGPTDVKFLLESMPNNWQAIKSRWVRRIGDVEHDEALNRKLSPQFNDPLPGASFLIAMGAHDPRVNPQHADRIVASLRRAGTAVEQLVYLDEGHGFIRPENNMDFFGRVEVFLARTLAGRAQAFSPQPGARVKTTSAALPAAELPDAQKRAILNEFMQLLKISNVAQDKTNIRHNADAIMSMMERRGLAPQLVESKQSPDAPPIVYGEWRVPNAKRTVVLYAHYDGQPVNPAEWATSPWEPTLRTAPIEAGGSIIAADSPNSINAETRLYARGTGDDKAGVIVILSAIDQLRKAHRTPTDNLKIVFEGEEEAGSPHLGQLLSEHRKLFASDLWVICDGPVHPTGRKEVIYGARGDSNIDLTVYGPNRALHSGHYGNWAPNPGLRLARLLASMKNDSGRVVIPGWYDDIAPLGRLEKQAVAAAAAYDDPVRRELGLAATESTASLAESWTEPSLNINGMRSANVAEQAANVIPASATAVLDVRLVLGNDPQRQFEKLVAFIRNQGFYVIDREPTADERLQHPLIANVRLRPGIYAAARTPMDHPLAHAIATAVRSSTREEIIELPTSGGSLPLSIVQATLDTQAIVVPIANYDDNQHAANENLRLGNLWEGIATYSAVLTH